MTTKAATSKEAVLSGRSYRNRLAHGTRIATNATRVANRRVPLFIPADQVYYWSNQWQRDEADSLADLKAGRVKAFADPKDAIRHLLSDD
jgi:hypothetical protein